MKISHKTLFVGLALAALISAPLAVTAMQGPPPQKPPEGKPDGKPEGKPEGRPEGREGRQRGRRGEEGGLEGAMQELNGTMKRLTKAFDKPDLEAIARGAVDMQRAVAAAKLETPKTIASTADAKEKAALMLDYRHRMIALHRSLIDMEAAALDGKADEAKKIFDALGAMKKEGHDKYKVD